MEKDYFPSNTAYIETQVECHKNWNSYQIDEKSFEKKLKQCDLNSCRGMCCYDGVYVSEEEAAILQYISIIEEDFFQSIDIKLPEQVIIDGNWKGIMQGQKTATKQWNFKEIVQDFPKHFTNTACVFLTKEGKCSLQLLSEYKGFHRWFYKPLTCWMHPIDINDSKFTVFDEETDPFILQNYDGYSCRTHCGRYSEDGLPAREVLQEELTYLEEMIGKDLINKI